MREPDDPTRRVAEGMAKVKKGDDAGWSDVLDALLASAAPDPAAPPPLTPPSGPRRYVMHRAPDVAPKPEPGPPCWWCGEPSELLCDTLLVGDGRVEGWAAMTCDAEMCAPCVAQSGRLFVSAGKDSYTDTMDTCPYCAELRSGKAEHFLRAKPEPEPDAAKAHVHAHRSRAREHGRQAVIEGRRQAMSVIDEPCPADA